jgi:hypothetical protein
MRQLTADTVIRVKASRPPLTGDTRIRLWQIKGLKEWIEDTDKPGTVKHWPSDDKDHRKQPDGSWPVVGSEEDKMYKKKQTKAVEVGEGEKPPIQIRTTEAELKKIPTIKVFPHKYTDKELEEMYKNLPDGINKKDGTRVEFTHSPYGKMIGHQGYDFKKIVPYVRKLFETAEPIFDSNYRSTAIRSDGSKHKEHSNILGYHHFLGKFKDEENQTYYVRFTTQEIKEPNPEKANNQMHNAFISNIDLYKEEATEGRSHSDMDREAKPPRGYDKMIAQFFKEVKLNKTTEDSADQKEIRLTLII